MGKMSRLGWLIGIHMGTFPVFLILAVTFNFKNHSFIPAYAMSLFIGILG
ncbi:hypothetical protein B7P43_G02011 [Cryptotermes secundus]|uniref:Uncharacterized protein n=1 Tax=Cryptotermes secundus TaxID=105785 RepID=A0A2J7Q995_9NEOP|nr:hypothetical protein B7P43_G02011 [Cryptotermes secundus]